MRRTRLVLSLALLVAGSLSSTSCTWLVAENNQQQPEDVLGPGALDLASGVGLEGELVEGFELPQPPAGCDESTPAPTEQALLTRFSLDVYPLMARDAGGCVIAATWLAIRSSLALQV